MDIINIPGAAAGNVGRVITAANANPTTDLVFIGSRVNNKRDGTQWAENYMKIDEFLSLVPNPTIVPIPSEVTTPIVINSGEIGLNIGGYIIGPGGSITINGTGVIYTLPLSSPGGNLVFDQVIPAAQVQTMNSSPIALLPILPANQYYAILSQPTVVRKAGTTPYNFTDLNGLQPFGLFYSTSQFDSSYALPFNFLDDIGTYPAGVDNALYFAYQNAQGDTINGKGVYLYIKGGDATQGDMDVRVTFEYKIITI